MRVIETYYRVKNTEGEEYGRTGEELVAASAAFNIQGTYETVVLYEEVREHVVVGS